MIERLKKLKAKKIPSAAELRNILKNDTQLRHEVEVLTKHFLGRSVSGCGNCFFDAYVELINLKKMQESKFKIVRGAVLYDPVNRDADKILTANNCTDELALYHLRHNPICRKYFALLPDNIDELLEEKPDQEKEPTEEEREIIEEIRKSILAGTPLKDIKEKLQERGFTIRKIAFLVKLAKAQ
jgi:hypothetical protein